MPPGEPILAIADQNLGGYNGHYWEYDTAVARIFAARGHKVIILANQSAGSALTTADAEIHPYFSHTSADISRPGIYRMIRKYFGRLPSWLLTPLRAAWHAVKGNNPPAAMSSFGEECVQAIRRFAPDMLFIQTAHAPELRALANTMRGTGFSPRLLVMLRREPEDPAMEDLNGIVKDLGDVCFYADTALLAQAWQRHLNRPVREVPVIYDLALIRKQPVPRQSKTPRTIMYLGNARAEKGFHLLPQLLANLEQKYARFSELEFHIQSHTAQDDDADPRIESALRKLQRQRNVTLYPHPLSQEKYIRLLMKADIVLLPYDCALYRRRSSGILMQALAAGKPAVVPEGSGFASAAPADATWRFTPGQLTKTVLEALDNYESFRLGAERHATGLDEAVMAQQFYEALTQDVIDAQEPIPHTLGARQGIQG